MPFLAKACLSAEQELLSMVFTHTLHTAFFCHLLSSVEHSPAPLCSVSRAVPVWWQRGNALGKAAGLGTEGVLLQPAILSHDWAAVPLFLTARTRLALSAYFLGLAIPPRSCSCKLYLQRLSFSVFCFLCIPTFALVLAVLVSL